MSTRGAFGFISGGEKYIMYNHSDSYPDWLGVRVLEGTKRLLEHGRALPDMIQNIRKVNATENPTPEDVDKYRHLSDTGVSTGKDWYATLRDLQGDIVGIVENGIMTDDSEFIEDNLFCEYFYIVDLDKNVFNYCNIYEWDLNNLPTSEEFIAITEKLEEKVAAN